MSDETDVAGLVARLQATAALWEKHEVTIPADRRGSEIFLKAATALTAQAAEVERLTSDLREVRSASKAREAELGEHRGYYEALGRAKNESVEATTAVLRGDHIGLFERQRGEIAGLKKAASEARASALEEAAKVADRAASVNAQMGKEESQTPLLRAISAQIGNGIATRIAAAIRALIGDSKP